MTTPETPPPNQASAAPPPPPTKSSGFGSWLIFIILLGFIGYTYHQGYLDKPLEMLTGTKVAQVAEPTTAQADAAPLAPAVIRSSSNADFAGVLTQLEAVQSRLIKIENENLNLQAISENLADQLSRQNGGEVSISSEEISRLELDVIDLRLQVSGDTHAAIRDLERLTGVLSADSKLQPIIATNLARLGQIPTRTQLLELFFELDTNINAARQDVNSRLQTINTEQAVDASVFETLFSVRRDDSQLQAELVMIEALSTTVAPARAALLQSVSGNYLERLNDIRAAADKLSSSYATLHTTAVARTLTQLTNFGFPESKLILDTTS